MTYPFLQAIYILVRLILGHTRFKTAIGGDTVLIVNVKVGIHISKRVRLQALRHGLQDTLEIHATRLQSDC